MTTFHVVTIFPDSLKSYLDSSMLFAAQKKGKIKVSVYDPRGYTKNKWKKVDDRPYGGGPGMVMAAEPILLVVESILKKIRNPKSAIKNYKIVLLTPRGKQFTNETARLYAKKYTHIILIAGHYEGIDARVKKILTAEGGRTDIEEVSVGPYVLTGGELPALAIIDSITRQIPGVLGDPQSLEESRVASADVYTRPEVLVYKKKKYVVPKVLLGGNHAEIEKWRAKKND